MGLWIPHRYRKSHSNSKTWMVGTKLAYCSFKGLIEFFQEKKSFWLKRGLQKSDQTMWRQPSEALRVSLTDSSRPLLWEMFYQIRSTEYQLSIWSMIRISYDTVIMTNEAVDCSWPTMNSISWYVSYSYLDLCGQPSPFPLHLEAWSLSMWWRDISALPK